MAKSYYGFITYVLAACLAGLVFSAKGWAACPIAVLSNQKGASIDRVARPIQAHYPSDYRLIAEPVWADRQMPCLIVSIGHASLKKVIALNQSIPVISVFVSRTAFETILRTSGKEGDDITAIYPDPPLSDQIQLARQLLGRNLKAHVLVGASNAYLRDDPVLTENHAITAHSIFEERDIYRSLKIIPKREPLIAIPDAVIYNENTLRSVMITAYRNAIPVIGFSPSMVNAGALATVYSDEEETVKVMMSFITEFLKTGKLPAPAYPPNQHVSVNSHIAQYYGVPGRVLQEIRQRMERAP